MNPAGLIQIFLALLLGPLLLSLINRTKARFAGRTGQPLLQPYFELAKLFRKGAVYSTTTTWVFRAGPVIGLATVLAALTLTPIGTRPGLLAFPGDFLVLAYLLGLGRFMTILAALDTGSSFEGMGASREAWFSALAEPVLIAGLAIFGLEAGNFSIGQAFGSIAANRPTGCGATMVLIGAALFIVFLAENSRIPVDDPTTHLELTMIHEVMVLDHSGPDFALISYTQALKLWVLGSLLTGLFLPVASGNLLADILTGLAGLAGVAIATGFIESTMARLQLVRIPHLFAGAMTLTVLALFWVLR